MADVLHRITILDHIDRDTELILIDLCLLMTFLVEALLIRCCRKDDCKQLLYFLEYSPGLELNPGQLTHPN